MKRNKMIKICAVTALASCLTAGLGVVAASASEPYTPSTQMTCLGASTKIVSNLKDSGLAFKYALDATLFESTAAGEVAFATGASAGIIVTPEALPADFDVSDKTTYGDMVKSFEIGAEYWGLNEATTKMEGIAYLYNIPDLDYDTEVTAIGYVTTSAGTTYTEPTVRTMAYVAQEALADTDEEWTADQTATLNGFMPVKLYYSKSVPLKIMETSAYDTVVDETTATAMKKVFGDYVYGITEGQQFYGDGFALSRAYLDAAFADESVLAVDFDFYCNNTMNYYGFAWGTAGSSEIEGFRVTVGANGILTGSVSRELYDAYIEVTKDQSDDTEGRDPQFPLNIRFYATLVGGNPPQDNIICVDNFRTRTLADYNVDFENGLPSADITPYNLTLSVLQSDVFGTNNYVYGLAEPSAVYGKGLTISASYLTTVFANEEVLSVDFDMYCNNTVRELRWCDGNATDMGMTYPVTNATGVFSVSITREVYDTLMTKDAKNSLVIRVYESTGAATTLVYFDNFRLCTLADFAIDFENGVSNTNIAAFNLTLSVLQSDVFGATSYVYGTAEAQSVYGKGLTISASYLTAVFANEAVTSIDFDMYCNNTIRELRWCDGSGTAMNLAYPVTSATGVFTVSITREVYNTLMEQSSKASLVIRVYESTGEATTLLYLDNFRPILGA